MAYSVLQSAVIDYPPEAMETFHGYSYEWIDNLLFVLPPELFIRDPYEHTLVARKRFLAAGWEGNGMIGLLWLPPFVFPLAQPAPSVGVVSWHVKQEEDGVSFLLSPIELPFEEFRGRLS